MDHVALSDNVRAAIAFNKAKRILKL